MNWNWENKSWPEFTFDSSALMSSEAKFLGNSGMLFGAFAHLDRDGQTSLRIDLLREEALQTSEIEGEHLNRESLQISLEKYEGTLIFVSHDREFVSALANRILEVRNDGTISDYSGTYEEYLRSQALTG